MRLSEAKDDPQWNSILIDLHEMGVAQSTIETVLARYELKRIKAAIEHCRDKFMEYPDSAFLCVLNGEKITLPKDSPPRLLPEKRPPTVVRSCPTPSSYDTRELIRTKLGKSTKPVGREALAGIKDKLKK